MTKRPVSDQQAGFAGGLNAVSDPAFLRPDQARQMANYKLSSYGAALKRLGTALTTAAPITTFGSLFSTGIYWPTRARIDVVAPATNTTTLHIYETTYTFPNANTWVDKGATTQYRSCLFTDGSTEILYLAGFAGVKAQKYDGTTIASLGAGTAGVDGLCVYNDRLWGWHNNILYYSNLSSAVGSTGGDSLGDITAGGGSIIVRTFGASNILACDAVNGSLLIWHEQGVSILTGWGQSDTQVQPQALNAAVGLGGGGSPDWVVVANTLSQGDVAYFVTTSGVYRTNGGFLQPLDRPDRPDPIAYLLRTQQIPTNGGNNFSIGFNENADEIWVWVSGVGVYAYNIILDAWSGPLTGTYAATQSGVPPITQRFFPVFSGSLAGDVLWRVTTHVETTGTNVSECDAYLSATPVYKDNVVANGSAAGTGGTAVTGTLQLHRMFCGDRVYAKSYRWLNILATLTSGAAAPTVSTTTPVGGTKSNTLSGLTSVEQPYYVSPGGQGAYIDVTITDAGTAGVSQYALATVEGYFLGQR